MRTMSSVQVIDKLTPIQNADNIETATVLGWEVVVKKGEFNEGDRVVYIEIDAWVPDSLAPFLSKGKVPKEYNGILGTKLKTARIRGQLSQGLILPINVLTSSGELGIDVSDDLGIQIWEAPPETKSGDTRGNFPRDLKKTDQERIQNCFEELREKVLAGEITDDWVMQEKLEGSSMQVARINDSLHVTSRNVDLKLDSDSHFIKVANPGILYLVATVAKEHPIVSFQGELIGPGVQGNHYKLNQHEFMLFDVWLGNRFASMEEQNVIIEETKALGFKIKRVPHLGIVSDLFKEGNSVKDVLKLAQINSLLRPDVMAEGIVFKNIKNPNITFKAINDLYLLNRK